MTSFMEAGVVNKLPINFTVKFKMFFLAKDYYLEK